MSGNREFFERLAWRYLSGGATVDEALTGIAGHLSGLPGGLGTMPDDARDRLVAIHATLPRERTDEESWAMLDDALHGQAVSRSGNPRRPAVQSLTPTSLPTPKAPPGGLGRDQILAARRAWRAEGPKSTAIRKRLDTTDATLIRARRFHGLVPWPED